MHGSAANPEQCRAGTSFDCSSIAYLPSCTPPRAIAAADWLDNVERAHKGQRHTAVDVVHWLGGAELASVSQWGAAFV